METQTKKLEEPDLEQRVKVMVENLKKNYPQLKNQFDNYERTLDCEAKDE